VDDFTGIAPEAYDKFRERIRTSPYADELGRIFCVVAVDSAGGIVGMGALDGPMIKRMYVSPERRGEGIGATIYGILEGEACRQGLRQLELESSLNAVGFYERLGFTKVREKTWYLEGSPVVNVIMSKELPSGPGEGA
jgi:GNAT superfamily N-acetyltransferase